MEEMNKDKTEIDGTADLVSEANADMEDDKSTTTTAEEDFSVSEDSHDDYNWSIGKKNVTIYPDGEKEDLIKLYEQTHYPSLQNNKLVVGKVASLTDSDVVLDIGHKSDGVISLNEFRDNPDLKKGDEIEVMVIEKEDKEGNLNLSRKVVKLEKAWEEIKKYRETQEIVKGHIHSKTKGGLIVDILGMDTFLPGSQIDIKPITDYDQFVGKTMEFKVIKINEAIRNAVISHKILIENSIELQKSEIINKLEKGQVLQGVVKNITDFGAFLDLGGVDGLLYVTDISWGRINHPSELLKLEDKVNVVVLDFDEDKKRISLGLKQLSPHPWDEKAKELKEGDNVKGKIVNIEDYGAFLEITPGIEGLIHVSEINWSNTMINSRDYFKLGDEMEAKIVSINEDEKKMSLSIRLLTEDPWETIEAKFPVDSKHHAKITNIAPYGVFVDINENFSGMVHVSDLSWIKRVNHPSELVKVGDDIEIIILGIDKENRKIHLGHKQIEEDPWDNLEESFALGSIHEGTITSKVGKDDKGSIAVLSYGIEAFIPKKHLIKQDGTSLKIDDTSKFMIIEFNRVDRKIIASHAKVWETDQMITKKKVSQDKRREKVATTKAINKINKNATKNTLGDLSSLQEIKKNLENNASK